MLLSMTGFGKAIATPGNKKITVEVKSLNSKQLDLAARIPAIYREKELELRNIVAERLGRGKIDLTVMVENTSAATGAVLNVPALQQYKQQVTDAAHALDIPLPADWYSVLLRFPDTLHTEVADTIDDDEFSALTQALTQALDALTSHRRAEGIKLESFFSSRIDTIAALLAEIPRHESDRIEKIRQRITDNLNAISQADLDQGRLEQEMIFYIEKLDINEEKQRLAQHLAYFMETLADPAASQGKKLGFISQEMGREINTLGSKSNNAEMQKLVVRMKDALEQIKEQVLNVL